MLRHSALVVLAALLGVVDAGAQVRRRQQQSPEPGYWVGLSIGYVEGMTTTDNKTNATWAFGYTSQLRATLEKTLQRGLALGVSAGYSTPPLTYSASSFDPNCPGRCQAHADVTQYLAFATVGSQPPVGFHGGFNLEGGVTQFSNFRDETTNAKLGATGSSDFTFGLGFEFGYRVSPTADLYAGAMNDFVLHPQSTFATQQAAPRVYNLRAGFRIGF